MYLIYDENGQPETLVDASLEDAVLEAIERGADDVVVDTVSVDEHEENPSWPSVDLALKLLRRPDGSPIRVTERAFSMSVEEALDELRQVAEGLLGGDWFDFFSTDIWSRPAQFRDWFLRDNQKLTKGREEGAVYLQGLAMVPHRILAVDETFGYYAGRKPKPYPNFCAGASAACSRSCLVYSGQQMLDNAVFPKFAQARMFVDATDAFVRAFIYAVDTFYSTSIGSQAKFKALRMNALSDIPWEELLDFEEAFGGEDRYFYDYTKIPGRQPPDIYDLTFSYSGTNLPLVVEELERGRRAAFVVHRVPGIRQGVTGKASSSKEVAKYRYPAIEVGGEVYPAVNGDHNDARFLDPAPSIVMLHWKPPTLKYKVSAELERQIGKKEAQRLRDIYRAERIREYREAIRMKFVVEVDEIGGMLVSAVTPSEQPDEISQSIVSLDPIDISVDEIVRAGSKRRRNPDRAPRVYRLFHGRGCR